VSAADGAERIALVMRVSQLDSLANTLSEFPCSLGNPNGNRDNFESLCINPPMSGNNVPGPSAFQDPSNLKQ
jgi:hypothetical protein